MIDTKIPFHLGSSDLTPESLAEGAWGTKNDPLYAQAVDIVRKNRMGSVSLVQRHLKIGWNRARGLLEAMVGSVIAEMPPTRKMVKKPND